MNVFQILVSACIGFYTVSYPMDADTQKKPTLESTFYALGKSAVHHTMEIILRDEKPAPQMSIEGASGASGEQKNKWQSA